MLSYIVIISMLSDLVLGVLLPRLYDLFNLFHKSAERPNTTLHVSE